MKSLFRSTTLVIFLTITILTIGCKKQNDWLDAKASKADVTPQTLADYQAILDNDNFINNRFTVLGLVSSDNLFLDNTSFTSAREKSRYIYTWNPSVWDTENGISYGEWNNMFATIEYANIVLDGLTKINSTSSGYNNLKGEALFLRSIAYYNLCQLFCKTYDKSTASGDLGMPIRSTSDVNIIAQRSTLQQTYDQMLDDARQAADLLDPNALNIRRPSRYAALALLSKIYFVMQDYPNAGLYANQVLTNYSTLLDFNNSIISIANTYRFPANGAQNPEIVFYAQGNAYDEVSPWTGSLGFVEPGLYSSYDNNDLRKKYFYIVSGTGGRFRGAYTGNTANFCGIANNELFLIRAECAARAGNTDAAMTDLNTLLRKRYLTGSFTDLVASNPDIALNIILQERRKELPFTSNIRWEDLRRLNKESRFQVTLTRNVNGASYTLAPNGIRYVFPVPQQEIQLTGIQPNP